MDSRGDDRGFLLRPPLTGSLIATLGLMLCVALVSAEGLWPTRDEARFQQHLRGEGPGAEPVADTDFVEMDRVGCFGACPTYTVRVHATGEVRFLGHAFVCRKGEAVQQIGALQARRLLAALRSIDWSAASPVDLIPDAEVVALRLRLGTRSVALDLQPAMHGHLRGIPAAIERVAEVGRWLPTWSLVPPGGPLCAGAPGEAPRAPSWWREGQVLFGEER
ncbi:DUF6438 domain-containing protein [Pelomonas sp. APW6]|uniref:DUF6438 domain-containing protein n=1 Tax=Roseateles subflavus TaxID=3053353 RepID=A0ABT7LI88_9BURK|nr:DUF6438 domain-containing protein [Pelomonas sp. APW6]MDL5032588.1 DUF6438 domain-containing protein [Pelomonas sp. APW6]